MVAAGMEGYPISKHTQTTGDITSHLASGSLLRQMDAARLRTARDTRRHLPRYNSLRGKTSLQVLTLRQFGSEKHTLSPQEASSYRNIRVKEMHPSFQSAPIRT